MARLLVPDENTKHWQLLTQRNIILRKTFPWGGSIQNFLWKAQPKRFDRNDIFISSDYGGEHKGSDYRTYAFLIAEQASPQFVCGMRQIRNSILKDNRRLAFKRLDDPLRQAALIPYLDTVDTLSGHLVVISIDKGAKWLFARNGEVQRWREALGLIGKWSDHAFEDMARKGYLVSIFLSLWSRPMTNVDWITDQDQSVANADRFDDLQNFVARMTSLLLPHKMGEFSMGSTGSSGSDISFEDLCALPDLAAGMASDVCTTLKRAIGWPDAGRCELENDLLKSKSDAIADWFWHSESNLKKTMIQIDHVPRGYSVRQIWLS